MAGAERGPEDSRGSRGAAAGLAEMAGTGGAAGPAGAKGRRRFFRGGGWRRRLGDWGGMEPLLAPSLPAEQPDLLAEVRRGWRQRVFRFFMPGSGKRPWHTAAVLAAVFLAVWAGGQFLIGGFQEAEGLAGLTGYGGGAAGAEGGSGGLPGGLAVGSPGVIARAEQYGALVAPAGPGGLPLIKHAKTGEVREVTEVELDYPSNRPFIPVEGVAGVVWNPGPRGLGLWWQPDVREELRWHNRLLLDRFAWRERQRQELEYALGEVSYSFQQLFLVDLNYWTPGPSARIYESMTRLQARYPSVRLVGDWALIPREWVCDANLQGDLDGDWGPGCPSVELEQQLGLVWEQVGRVSERLRELGRRGQDLSELDPLTVVDLDLGVKFGYDVLAGQEDLAQLQAELLQLREFSRRENLPITVGLTPPR